MDTDSDSDGEQGDQSYVRVKETSTENEFEEGFRVMLSKKRKRDDVKKSRNSGNGVLADLVVKFVVIFSTVDPRVSLRELSSITLAREVGKLVGDVESLKKLERGDIVVNCKTAEQMNRALSLQRLCDIRVKAYIPKSLSQSRGVIYNVDIDITEEEIADNLRSQNVSCKTLMSW